MSVPFYMKKDTSFTASHNVSQVQGQGQQVQYDNSRLVVDTQHDQTQKIELSRRHSDLDKEAAQQAAMFRSNQSQTPRPITEVFDFKMYNSQTSIPEQQILSFDHLLTDIGFGKYQYWIYAIMALNGITEGSQITIFTLMMPILKHEWGVSDELNSLQASFVFIGFLLGSMISGQFSDRMGRRRPFLYSAFFTNLFSLCSIFCGDIYTLLIFRFLMGILVGFFAPCGVTMLSEITPVDLRGRYMGLITLTFALGQLFGLFVASFTLTSLDSGNWRMLTFWCTMPGMIAWILCLTKMLESPRFELLARNNESAFEIIELMNSENKGNALLDEYNKFRLVNWAHNMNRIAKNQQNASLSSLFVAERGKLTCLLWFNWFTLSFMYYGIVLLLPFTLQNIKENNTVLGNDKLLQLVISSISDICGAIVASFLIELQGFGRKNSLIIFYGCQAFTSFLVYFDNARRFILWATASKFFLSMTFIFSFQYTAEVYPTKIRTTGVGMANGVGRLGGVIMPWICIYFANQQLLSPFLLFSGLSLITSLSNFALPYDTMGKELDA